LAKQASGVAFGDTFMQTESALNRRRLISEELLGVRDQFLRKKCVSDPKCTERPTAAVARSSQQVYVGHRVYLHPARYPMEEQGKDQFVLWPANVVKKYIA
jgi:hypothetical protein